MPNQHKPLPPDDEIKPWVQYYWDLGMNQKTVVENVLDHIDMAKYGFSVSSLKQKWGEWDLLSTWQQKHTVETIQAAVQETRERFPHMGSCSMVYLLRQDYSMRVPECVVTEYLKMHEPDAVEQRKHKKWKRKRFWAAGINDIIAIDQHDKWRSFGLFFHVGIEPFVGWIVWLKPVVEWRGFHLSPKVIQGLRILLWPTAKQIYIIF
ncbi:hypothetical protein WOLCODRAFT_14630 [Wolfiporia cocos MD-104 SS10]|uniref:Clr5 domain-containing protein n=1 Tax=Wolfiporia cocos (strain MD-104) TaxID=742152 RepID=A0A2H3J9I1_WOLCO|nr:hypothetical protein WOLCODRAFT_14630 [Wolfiporia cocos MD-104 SS10]